MLFLIKWEHELVFDPDGLHDKSGHASNRAELFVSERTDTIVYSYDKQQKRLQRKEKYNH